MEYSNALAQELTVRVGRGILHIEEDPRTHCCGRLVEATEREE